MKKLSIKDFAKITIVAALYVALTLSTQLTSYGAIQVRLAEILMLLVLYNPKYSISLILGCLISNIASPLGFVDIFFGTLATALACFTMILVKKPYIAALFPVLFNGLIVGLELTLVFEESPFWFNALTVSAGEFIAVYIIGILVFILLERNKQFLKIMGFEPIFKKEKNNLKEE